MTLLEHVYLKSIYLAEGKRKRGGKPLLYEPKSNRITFQNQIASSLKVGMAKATI